MHEPHQCLNWLALANFVMLCIRGWLKGWRAGRSAGQTGPSSGALAARHCAAAKRLHATKAGSATASPGVQLWACMHAAAAFRRHQFMCTFVKRILAQAIWQGHCWALLGLQNAGGNSGHKQLPLAIVDLMIATTIIMGMLLFVHGVNATKKLHCSALSC